MAFTATVAKRSELSRTLGRETPDTLHQVPTQDSERSWWMEGLSQAS